MSNEDLTLAVPGVVHVRKAETGDGVVAIGRAAGYIAERGIREWSHELSVIARKDLTDALREQLGVTLPENRIAKSKHPLAFRAAETSPLIAVIGDLAPQLVEKGVRVHTIGFDRVTGGFMYFAEGGKEEPVRVHGDLLEMIEPALAGGSSNEDIERYLNRFVDRLLQHFSKGLLSELGVELANALPRLATDARGLAGVDVDAFEAEAAANAEKGKKHEEGAKKLADALAGANGSANVKVPLFGEAKGQTQPAMDIVVAGASVTLPARTLWTVSGAPKEEAKPVAAAAAVSTPKPAAAAASTSKPVVTPAPAAAKPAAASVSKPPAAASTSKPTPAPASTSKPAPAPAAQPKIPAALAATPQPAPAPVPKPVEPAPVSKPEEAPVAVSRPVAVIGVGEAPKAVEPSPKPEPVVEKQPEPVVEAKPEPKPEPVVEAKPEPKPEPVVEKKPEPKPEPVAEKKPEPKPVVEAKPEKKPVKEPEPEKAAPPPEPAKSNTMLFVIIAILVIAAIAFFAMKKH